MFPVISHIDDVKHIIADRPEFIVIDKGDYIVIDYVFQDQESFSTAIEKECRGIIFDKSGKLIRRPLHKFFNLGERGDDNVNLDDLLIIEKLDGSMVTPLYINSNLRLATRKGVTEYALDAEVYIADKPMYKIFMDRCEENGVTPVFEWLSTHKPNVIEYPDDDLILLAMRFKDTGEYMSRTEVAQQANSLGIPIARAYRVADFDKFVEETRASEGDEGYVVYSGKHMFKIKSDWYCRLHRVKDSTRKPRNVVKLIIDNQLDDILPVLDEPNRKKVEEFRATFSACLGRLHREGIAGFDEYVMRFKEDRKEFAINSKLPNHIKRGVFAMIDGQKSLSYVMGLIARGARTDTEWLQFNEDILQMEAA